MPKFPVTAPVNTAAALAKDAKTTIDFRTLNCAACTAGALTGLTSGAVVGQVFKLLNGRRSPMPGYEPETTFKMLGNEARARNNTAPTFPLPQRKAGQDANDHANNVMAVEQENELDAQVEALKLWVSGRRGGTCDHHGSVQNLVPFAAAQLWMATRPSWTEFAVYFTSFQGETSGHWIYAENRDHTVEFVDYQQFLTAANRPAPSKYPSCAGHSAPDAKVLVLSFSP
jgi:hypothetical protein